MTKRSVALFLLITLFVTSQFASPSNIETSELFLPDSSTCAQTCNQNQWEVYYANGMTYTYQVYLMTRVVIYTRNENYNYDRLDMIEQEIRISAFAEISAKGPCELVLNLRKVNLTGLGNDAGLQLEQEPIHFSYENGKIVDVCASHVDNLWVINVKKLIISTLQMTSSDVSKNKQLLKLTPLVNVKPSTNR